MTPKQQKLVEENHNLIYSFARTYSLDLEMWYDILALALCRAAINFDANKAKFSTYFYTSAMSAMRHEFRKGQAQKRKAWNSRVSLEEYISADVMLEERLYDDTINITTQIEMSDFLHSLVGIDKQIVCLRLQGLKQKVIAQELGISQSAVSNRLKVLKHDYISGGSQK